MDSFPLDHRPLLQYVISVKSLSQEALAKFWVAHFNQTYSELETPRRQLELLTDYDILEQVEQQVSKINMLLLPMNYEVKKHKDRLGTTEGIYYSFVNLVEDTPSKLNTEYSAEDVKVITTIIKKCMENGAGAGAGADGNLSIGSLDALNEYKKETGKPISAGQNLFQNMIQNGWLSLNSTGQYTLGTRLIAELESQLLGGPASNEAAIA